jgi:hypothetical protein
MKRFFAQLSIVLIALFVATFGFFSCVYQTAHADCPCPPKPKPVIHQHVAPKPVIRPAPCVYRARIVVRDTLTVRDTVMVAAPVKHRGLFRREWVVPVLALGAGMIIGHNIGDTAGTITTTVIEKCPKPKDDDHHGGWGHGKGKGHGKKGRGKCGK